MSDDLRWSWCNDNRNKVHSECNVVESSRNHPPTPRSLEKLYSTKTVPGAKKVGDRWCRVSINLGLSHVFSWLDWAYMYFREEHPRGEVLSLYHIREYVILTWIIIGDIHLHHLGKWCITGSFTVKLFFSPFHLLFVRTESLSAARTQGEVS